MVEKCQRCGLQEAPDVSLTTVSSDVSENLVPLCQWCVARSAVRGWKIRWMCLVAIAPLAWLHPLWMLPLAFGLLAMISLIMHELGHALAFACLRVPVAKIVIGNGHVLWQGRFGRWPIEWRTVPASGCVYPADQLRPLGASLSIASGPAVNLVLAVCSWRLLGGSQGQIRFDDPGIELVVALVFWINAYLFFSSAWPWYFGISNDGGMIVDCWCRQASKSPFLNFLGQAGGLLWLCLWALIVYRSGISEANSYAFAVMGGCTVFGWHLMQQGLVAENSDVADWSHGFETCVQNAYYFAAAEFNDWVSAPPDHATVGDAEVFQRVVDQRDIGLGLLWLGRQVEGDFEGSFSRLGEIFSDTNSDDYLYLVYTAAATFVGKGKIDKVGTLMESVGRSEGSEAAKLIILDSIATTGLIEDSVEVCRITVPWLRAYQEKHGDTPTICGTLGSVLILLKQEEEEAAALLLRCQAESCESIDVGVASLFLALYHRGPAPCASTSSP